MAAIYPLVVIPFPLYINFPAGIIVPSGKVPLGYFYAPRYIMLAVLSLAGFIILVKNKVNLKHPVFIPLAFFICFFLISTLLASNQVTAWIGSLRRFTGFSTYFFCFIMFILASCSSRPLRILKCMAGCAAFISLLAVFQHFEINLVPYPPLREGFRPFGTLANPDFLGTYTVFILPAAIFFYLRSSKVSWLACAGLIYAALLVSYTRGAWLSFALVFTVITVYVIKFTSKKKLLGLVMVTFILVTALLLPTRDSSLASRATSISSEVSSAVQLEDSAGSHRMTIWKQAAALLPKYWAFGMGPDHLIYAGIRTPGGIADKTHNIYLEKAVTTGVFSLLSYLAFIGFFIIPRKGFYNFMFFTMVLAYLAQGFFNIDVVMVLPLFWIVLGLYLNCICNPEHFFQGSYSV
ncbi:MAG: O-antigen ligase family protein [Clostridiales bacterium]|nr:O-antigen ligase family protein [Clostridiales bacterium]MCF8021143.1 O-antigen ligase family protein [Clostridiales bacterium]